MLSELSFRESGAKQIISHQKIETIFYPKLRPVVPHAEQPVVPLAERPVVPHAGGTPRRPVVPVEQGVALLYVVGPLVNEEVDRGGSRRVLRARLVQAPPSTRTVRVPL